MPKSIILHDELKVSVKQDIARFYMTGKSTLKSIQEHYNLKTNTMRRLVDEIIYDSNKTNKLF